MPEHGRRRRGRGADYLTESVAWTTSWGSRPSRSTSRSRARARGRSSRSVRRRRSLLPEQQQVRDPPRLRDGVSVRARSPDCPLADRVQREPVHLARSPFLLGAVTHYEGPDIWALEIAPYDTATAEMITKLYKAVQSRRYFGSKLAFHPTSEAVEAVAENCRASPIATTAQSSPDRLSAPQHGETLGQSGS